MYTIIYYIVTNFELNCSHKKCVGEHCNYDSIILLILRVLCRQCQIEK